jgi:hypothetical protein
MRALAALLALALPSWAGAATPTLSGKLWTHARAPVEKLSDPWHQISISAWVDGTYEFTENARAFLLLQVDEIAQSTARTEGLRLKAREAYLRYDRGGLELRLGQQIFVRGISDGISPNDVLGARDFTLFTADEEFRRQGLLALLASYSPKAGNSPLTFTFTWAARPLENTLLIPATLAPSGVTVNELTKPEFSLRDSETSVRAAYVGDGFDFALQGYIGWNRTPYYSVLSRSGPTTFTVGPVLERLKLIGTEASTSFGKWVFRGEAALRVAESSFNTIDTVLGAERPLGERFRLQVQAAFRALTDYRPVSSVQGSDVVDTSVRQGLARLNRILHNQKREIALSATTRLSYTSESGDWEPEIFLMLNANGGDYLLRPMSTLAIYEGLRWSLGAEVFGGSMQEPLGALGPYRAVFTEFKYFF